MIVGGSDHSFKVSEDCFKVNTLTGQVTRIVNPLGSVSLSQNNVANHNGTIHAIITKNFGNTRQRYGDFLIKIPRGNLYEATVVNIDGRDSKIYNYDIEDSTFEGIFGSDYDY